MSERGTHAYPIASLLDSTSRIPCLTLALGSWRVLQNNSARITRGILAEWRRSFNASRSTYHRRSEYAFDFLVTLLAVDGQTQETPGE